MHLYSFLIILSIFAASCSALPPHFKRDISTNVTLYAYGTNISGLAIYYGQTDGLAYIASTPPTNLSSITFAIDDSGEQTWNASFSNSSTAGTFYIVDGGSTYDAAGFLSSNTTSTASTNVTTTGFSLFGGQVVCYSSDTAIESQFWAQTTAVDDVWSLVWNSDGDSQVDSVPVTIKTVAPVTAATANTADKI